MRFMLKVTMAHGETILDLLVRSMGLSVGKFLRRAQLSWWTDNVLVRFFSRCFIDAVGTPHLMSRGDTLESISTVFGCI